MKKNIALACNQYASEKTKLYFSINEACEVSTIATSENKVFTYNDNGESFTDIDGNGTITEEIKPTYKTDVEKLFRINNAKRNDSFIDYLLNSEYIASFIEHVSYRFVYTALKTVYTQSANKRIFELLKQAERMYFGSNNETFSNYETYENHESNVSKNAVYIESKDGELIPLSDCISKKDYKTETAVSHFMEVVTHKYKMITDNNGKKHRIEVIPYNELKLTAFGKKICANIDLKELTVADVADLITISKIACYELINSGMIRDFNSFSYYRSYCYNKINSEINARKAQIAKFKQMNDNTTTEEETETEESTIAEETETREKAYHEKSFKSIENASVKESIISYVIGKLDSRTNKKKIEIAYRMHLNGETGAYIAKILEVSEMTISKYLSYCEKVASADSDNIRKIIAGYTEETAEATNNKPVSIAYSGNNPIRNNVVISWKDYFNNLTSEEKASVISFEQETQKNIKSTTQLSFKKEEESEKLVSKKQEEFIKKMLSFNCVSFDEIAEIANTSKLIVASYK